MNIIWHEFSSLSAKCVEQEIQHLYRSLYSNTERMKVCLTGEISTKLAVDVVVDNTKQCIDSTVPKAWYWKKKSCFIPWKIQLISRNTHMRKVRQSMLHLTVFLRCCNTTANATCNIHAMWHFCLPSSSKATSILVSKSHSFRPPKNYIHSISNV